MPIVMGIDPGSLTTGYALLEPRNCKVLVLEYGVIRPPAKASLMERLGYITTNLDAILCQYHPHSVALESIFFARNARSALVLGHARGAILSTCHRHGVALTEFAPREVKQAVSGRGAASKEAVANLMQQHLHLRSLPTPSDAADALALAWTYLQRQTLQLPPGKSGKKSSPMKKRQALLQLIAQAQGEKQS